MKTSFDCIPCFVRQTLDAAKSLELGEETALRLMHRTLSMAQDLDWTLPPPVIGRDIHRAIREITGSEDPYLSIKVTDTEKALALLPAIRQMVAQSEDPFVSALKMSIAGNSIDLGAKTQLDADVQKAFNGALSKPLDIMTARRLEKEISAAEDILFLADNAGEIVFDLPLLSHIGPDKVIVVVRGNPVINDATLEDTVRSGITASFRVITNGSDTTGTWLPDCSKDFVGRFEMADLVLAKGQGNYESLSDHPCKIFFLFLTKCAVVAEDVGLPVDNYVILER